MVNRLEVIYVFNQKRGGRSRELYDRYKSKLEAGQTPNEQWSIHRRSSPLCAAVLDGDVQLAGLLLDHGAASDSASAEGWTALQEAVIASHAELVTLLLAKGAPVDSRSRSDFLEGSTALHLAVFQGAVEIASTLLNHDANPLAKSETGWTPVHIAVLEHQTTLLELLLARVERADLILADSWPDEGADMDERDLATHLLEHGTRGTDRRHVLMLAKFLSNTIGDLGKGPINVVEDASTLIDRIGDLIMKQAKTTVEIGWARSLCASCEQFENQDSNDLFTIFEHSPDRASLERSATEGCNLCKLLVARLQGIPLHQIDKKYIKRWGVTPKVRLSVERSERPPVPRQGDHSLMVACEDRLSFTDLNYVQGHINAAVAQSGPSDVRSTGSERSLAIAKSWLQRCETEHPSCRQRAMSALPTRVIDVGSESMDARVYVSRREREPYATLSYCWGGTSNIKLLSSGTEGYYERLPPQSLPNTIADAIKITRHMGVRYLWIDALCILQDSDDDLRRELSYMGEIYAGSHFTIAAKTSSSCSDGCFRKRDWPTSAIIPTNLRLPNKVNAKLSDTHGRELNTRSSCFNRVMVLPRHIVRSQNDRDRPGLETRGWTLQEEVLSRRVLECGKDELAWTCLEGACSERSPEEGTVKFFGSHWQNSIRIALATGVAGHGSSTLRDNDELFDFWLNAVENYTQRYLSNARDKLVAVAGVHAAIGKLLKDGPVAGIWQESWFAAGLLWTVKTDDDRIMHKLDCPSWSWASVPKPVQYCRLPIRKLRPGEGWWEDFEYLIEAIAWDLAGTERPGRVTGSVTVRCRLLKKADMNCEKHVAKDFLNRPPKSASEAEAIHYEIHNDSADDTDTLDAWVIPVRTMQHVVGNNQARGDYDIETKLLRLKRISEDRLDFRRVGLVTVRSWKNRWLSKASTEIVRLF